MNLRKGEQLNRSDLAAIGALALWSPVFFWQAALRQSVFFFGDILRFFYPTHLAYADALRAGRLPLWEPRLLAGFPLFAEGQIGALYPTHPLLYGLLPLDLATNYDILTSLAWVSVGMYLFLRVLCLRPASAFLGALSFGFGGFFVARVAHMSVLTTAAWLPWLFWCWEKLAQETDDKRRWQWWALLALFSGIQLLGGHPQFAFMSVLLLGLYSIVRWQRDETPTRNPFSPFASALSGQVREKTGFSDRLLEYLDPRRVILVVSAIGVGALLAAPQLLPTFELSTLSDRAAGLLPKFFNAFSLRWIHYLMLFHPFILGNPYPNVSVEVIGYIGFLPGVLALGAPLARRDRRVAFFALVALAALVLGLGDQNPFYRGLRYLPLFNYFRVPARFLFLYSFAAATLAAITFDYLLARAQVMMRLTRGQQAAMALCAVSLAVIVGLYPAVPLDWWLSLWTWLPLLFALLTAWVVLGARRGLFTRTTLVTLAVGLTAIDLALVASVYAKTYDLMVPVQDSCKPPSALSLLKDLSPQEGRILTSWWIYPVMVTMRESLYPNVSLLYNLPSAIGYTPLIPQRTSEYLDQLTAPMLSLLNVRYYIIPQMLPIDAETEGKDLANAFAPDFLTRDLTFAPTPATKLRVVSSLAQSVDLRDGAVVARIDLVTQDGQRLTLPLRAGYDTAEWAYERSDVRKVIRHSLPPIATTFPARSAFPTEAHLGHNYIAEFDLARDGQPIVVTGIRITPTIAPGLIHIERVALGGVVEGREVSLAHLVGRADQTLIYRTNEAAVFQNNDVLPRAFLVHDARAADDAMTLKEITRDEFKPLETLFLAGGTPLSNGSVQRADEMVSITSYQPEHVALAVRAQADAYLFLADAWYPGWIARVDGVETPIARGDYVFRAVRVGAGAHQVEFEYRPFSLYIGAGISLVAVLLLGVCVLRSRRIVV